MGLKYKLIIGQVVIFSVIQINKSDLYFEKRIITKGEIVKKGEREKNR